jgi:hypothetical protein
MKKYTVRRIGEPLYSETNSMSTAREDAATANRVICPGHVVVDNITGCLVWSAGHWPPVEEKPGGE